jgi:hypothetical protein
MAGSTLPTLQARPTSVPRMRPLGQAVPGAAPSLIGRDQFTDERRPSGGLLPNSWPNSGFWNSKAKRYGGRMRKGGILGKR